MDSYVIRIYRRAGRKSRLLIGTAEAVGTGGRMAFSNIEELREILTHRKDRDPFAPQFPRRRMRKEVVNGTAETFIEECADGVRQVKPT